MDYDMMVHTVCVEGMALTKVLASDATMCCHYEHQVRIIFSLQQCQVYSLTISVFVNLICSVHP